MDEGLDGELNKKKGLRDEVVAAGHHGTGAAVEVGKDGDKDDGGFFVAGQGAQFGAEFKAGHAGHVHVQKDEVERVFGKELEGGVRVFDVDGLEMGLFQG